LRAIGGSTRPLRKFVSSRCVPLPFVLPSHHTALPVSPALLLQQALIRQDLSYLSAQWNLPVKTHKAVTLPLCPPIIQSFRSPLLYYYSKHSFAKTPVTYLHSGTFPLKHIKRGLCLCVFPSYSPPSLPCSIITASTHSPRPQLPIGARSLIAVQ
jgi:hypothetical protein